MTFDLFDFEHPAKDHRWLAINEYAGFLPFAKIHDQDLLGRIKNTVKNSNLFAGDVQLIVLSYTDALLYGLSKWPAFMHKKFGTFTAHPNDSAEGPPHIVDGAKKYQVAPRREVWIKDPHLNTRDLPCGCVVWTRPLNLGTWWETPSVIPLNLFREGT